MAIQIPIISEFDGKGIAKAKKEFAQLEGVGAKAQYAIKKAAIPAAAALAGVGAALADATKGAIEDAAAQDKLAGQLRRTVGATDATIKATEDWIATQGTALGITDDKLRPALAKLTVASKDLARAQKLAKLAFDISAASGKDLETVTNALVKAENGQFASLKKLGVPIGDNTQALMDMAAETKKVHKAELELNRIREGGGTAKEMAKATENLREAQARLNAVTVEGADYADDLAKVFGGAASDAANTTAGKFQRMKIALDETKESIGAALIPVIEKALPLLQKMADWAQKNPQAFTAIAAAIGAIAASIVAVNIAMALNPFTLIAAGIAAVGVAAVYAYNKFETFRKGVNFIINNVIASINAVIRGLNLLPKVNIPTIPQIGAGGNGSVPTLSGADMSRFDVAPTMATSQSVNSPVTINVNGGDPNAVVGALRKYMAQNGSIPIRVAL